MAPSTFTLEYFATLKSCSTTDRSDLPHDMSNMNILGSTQQLEHEHALADQAHQTNTLSTATIQSPMALNSKTDLVEATTSTTEILARIDMSIGQSPAQQNRRNHQSTHQQEPPSRIMDARHRARPQHPRLRPSTLSRGLQKLRRRGTTAAEPLSAFERRTWQTD